MNRIRTGMAAGVLAVLLVAGATQAQSPARQATPPDPVAALLPPAPAPAKPAPAVNDGEAWHRAPDEQQDPEELRVTRALNDEILQRNLLAENQERADRAAFEAERARHEAEVTRARQAQLAYEAALREAEAAQRRWAADRAQWEADIRACEAGDRTRCPTRVRP
ncbi:MAG: cell wall hydrolase [Brevundimonas sp.]|uniref:cell wall hydrolase n=1 Tax=Brevundimonas sp. TaxID=1871086 RepID=UPI002735D8D8|nr:cell wall hydrolase [Brevundimonas sp.]MDP3403995.1 cell wall hydrolase [Brevundimonas sp.]